MKQPTFELSVTGPAIRDLGDILGWSARHFGVSAADRYKSLIGQAFLDLRDDPFRPGAKQRPGAQDRFIYHLAASRDRTAGERVKAPRHFISYRVTLQTVEVLRILHDSRDLARHLSGERPEERLQ